MSNECSFDIASKVDCRTVDNAVHQTTREIAQRFDLRAVPRGESGGARRWSLSAEDEFKLKAVAGHPGDKSWVKRQVPLQGTEPRRVESAAAGRVRQRIELQQGIPIEKARELVKLIKGTKRKVQAQIQEAQVRVFAATETSCRRSSSSCATRISASTCSFSTTARRPFGVSRAATTCRFGRAGNAVRRWTPRPEWECAVANVRWWWTTIGSAWSSGRRPEPGG